jgi:hypothetical protein
LPNNVLFTKIKLKICLNIFQIEKENTKLQVTLKSLKDDAIKSFKPRTPKKLTDLTTKLQMKKMVEELENEIGKILKCFKRLNDFFLIRLKRIL